MKRPSFIATCAACLLAFASFDVDARVELVCPTRISLKPAFVDDVPQGWHPNQRSTLSYVRGVSISLGPPEERGDLKPDIRTIKSGKSFSWKLPAESEPGVWLSCGYENTVALSQRLPAGLSSCRAILSTTEDGYPSVVISCQ